MPNFSGTATEGRAPEQAPKFRGTGGGSFVSPKQLIGELIIIAPIEMEKVKGYNAKPEDALKDRLTADVVVLTGDLAGEYPGMWWNQGNIVKQAKRILGVSENAAGTGFDTTGRVLDEVIAGRLHRTPKRDFKDVFPTREDLEAAFAKNAKMVPTTSYSWTIDTMDDADVQLATAYYTSGRQLPESGPEGDPFGDDD